MVTTPVLAPFYHVEVTSGDDEVAVFEARRPWIRNHLATVNLGQYEWGKYTVTMYPLYRVRGGL